MLERFEVDPLALAAAATPAAAVESSKAKTTTEAKAHGAEADGAEVGTPEPLAPAPAPAPAPAAPGRWRSLAPMSAPRRLHGAAFCPADGCLYVFGGNSTAVAGATTDGDAIAPDEGHDTTVRPSLFVLLKYFTLR